MAMPALAVDASMHECGKGQLETVWCKHTATSAPVSCIGIATQSSPGTTRAPQLDGPHAQAGMHPPLAAAWSLLSSFFQ